MKQKILKLTLLFLLTGLISLAKDICKLNSCSEMATVISKEVPATIDTPVTDTYLLAPGTYMLYY